MEDFIRCIVYFSGSKIQRSKCSQVNNKECHIKNKSTEKLVVDYMKALKMDSIALNGSINQEDSSKNVNLVQVKEIKVDNLAAVSVDITTNKFDLCEFIFLELEKWNDLIAQNLSEDNFSKYL